jgi:CheY-like chemotaxis protein
MLQRVIGEDIQLVVSLAPDAWEIKADRGQLHQVLMNLVINGREAMPEGGTLSIGTSNTTDERGRDCLMIEVRDTGVGMDERTRRHIFEPFFTNRRHGKGTGLGMATVYGVVTQGEGHISVESQPGQGATFRLYFPRHAAPSPAEAVPEAAPAAAAGGRKVLLVEDQQEVRAVTSMILRGLGYSVLEADSGEGALAVSQDFAGEIDLLITDVIMPGMNGRELAGRFAAARPKAQVIFMSGYPDRISSGDPLLDPSVNFLQKPFGPEELAGIVSRVFAVRDHTR